MNMKKALILALAVLPVLFACNKNNSGSSSNLPTPKNDKEAAKVVVKEEIRITTSDKKDLVLKEINFMRSGRYVAVGEYSLKASSQVVLTGKYTVTNGTYTVSGDINGSFTTTSTSVSYTEQGGETQTSSADVTPSNVQEGSAQDKAFRTWKLSGNNALFLDFPSLGKAGYPNISALVNDLANHDIQIDPQLKEKLLKYDIVEISLDNKEICITFSQADPFKGSFVVGEKLNFTYDLSAFMTGENIFQAKAVGTIEFEDNKALVKMDVNSSIEKLGNGKGVITLVPVD